MFAQEHLKADRGLIEWTRPFNALRFVSVENVNCFGSDCEVDVVRFGMPF